MVPDKSKKIIASKYLQNIAVNKTGKVGLRPRLNSYQMGVGLSAKYILIWEYLTLNMVENHCARVVREVLWVEGCWQHTHTVILTSLTFFLCMTRPSSSISDSKCCISMVDKFPCLNTKTY